MTFAGCVVSCSNDAIRANITGYSDAALALYASLGESKRKTSYFFEAKLERD